MFIRFGDEANSSAQRDKPRDCEPGLTHRVSLDSAEERSFPVFPGAEPLSSQEAGLAQWGVKEVGEVTGTPRLKTEILRPGGTHQTFVTDRCPLA